MPENLIQREAAIVGSDVTTRSLTVQLLQWDDPRTVVDPGRAPYIERWARDALTPRDRLYVLDRHGGDLIGRMAPPADAGPGPAAELTIADTAAGRDLLALVDAGVVEHVSIEALADPAGEVWSADHREVTRTRAELCGVAFSFSPAHHAPILARQQETPMPEIIEATAVEDAAEDEAAPAALERASNDQVQAEQVELRRQVATLAARIPTTPAGGHPLQRFNSLGEYAYAVFRDATLVRALADQITTNNPGVIPPGWVSEVFGILDHSSPLVAHLRRPAPDAGMDVNWPYFDGDLYALVGQQVTQKSAVTSVRVDLKRATEPLLTYAGGSDLSLQLIQRSDPSYLDAYMRIMTAAYGAVVGKAFATDLLAGSAMHVLLDPATATMDTAAAAIFEASTDVARATGTPASIIAAGDAMFVALGKAALTVQAGVGAGAASASNLSISYAGLEVVFDPALPTGSAIATNRNAAAWFEDGPSTLTAEDVEKLGRNVAVWGMGAAGVMLPNGVVEISAVASDPSAASSSSRKKA